MFIGRKHEFQLIEERLHNNQKELVAITGKRGVGKTYLMLNLEKKLESLNSLNKTLKSYYFLKLEGKKSLPKKVQIEIAFNKLRNLAQLINSDLKFELFQPPKNSINNWNDFFEILKDFILTFENYISSQKLNSKIICFIDEFPWLNVKGSYFVEEFGSFWNLLSSSLFKIVLTGSAISWINKNVFRNKGGLYHKTTLKIALKSFDLLETRDYLRSENPHISNEKIISYYLITGGVARYLQQIRFNRTLHENQLLIYENNDYFDDFFNNTFNSTKTNLHKEIVSLFSNRIKLTFKEIEKGVSNKINSISLKTIYGVLKELVETDVLLELPSFNKGDKEYLISDLFCFYHLRKSKWKRSNHQNAIIDGFSLEILTYKNIHRILTYLNRGGFNFDMYRWQNKEAQIDMLLHYSNGHFSLIECKNYNTTILFGEKQEDFQILHKMETFLNNLGKRENKKVDIDVILVSLFGSKNNSTINYLDVPLVDLLNV